MVSVHPARRCTSPLGVVPAGLGEGAGDCHDVANLPRVRSFHFPFLYLFDEKRFTLVSRVLVLWSFKTAGYASSQVGAHSMLR